MARVGMVAQSKIIPGREGGAGLAVWGSMEKSRWQQHEVGCKRAPNIEFVSLARQRTQLKMGKT